MKALEVCTVHLLTASLAGFQFSSAQDTVTVAWKAGRKKKAFFVLPVMTSLAALASVVGDWSAAAASGFPHQQKRQPHLQGPCKLPFLLFVHSPLAPSLPQLSSSVSSYRSSSCSSSFYLSSLPSSIPSSPPVRVCDCALELRTLSSSVFTLLPPGNSACFTVPVLDACFSPSGC